jgi:hypothetical protein
MRQTADCTIFKMTGVNKAINLTEADFMLGYSKNSKEHFDRMTSDLKKVLKYQ